MGGVHSLISLPMKIEYLPFLFLVLINSKTEEKYFVYVRCGYCGSVMSSHYSIKNGQKYFYYKCTRVMHRDKKACPSKPLSAREFENAIVEKIKELSQDRKQLVETLKNANYTAPSSRQFFKNSYSLLEL